jgi:murein DD-endopeptidase MepM/ murein hydrolase activator NlpD
MSYRSSAKSYRPDSGRVVHDKREKAERSPRSTYTFAHAGRQVRLGPVTFWIVVGTTVVMAGWSLATGTYFAFKDDVLSRLISRQAEQQYAYEDRIAELRGQLDRVTSRQMIDQEQFDHKLEQVIRRQSTLETRATRMTTLPDPTPTGSIRRNRASPISEQPSTLKASPINDTVIFTVPPDREARLESRVLPATANRFALVPVAHQPRAGLDGTLQRLQASLDRVEMRQTVALNVLEERYDAKAKRIRGVLADLGLDKGKTPLQPGIGGPYVPVKLPGDASAFERQLYRIQLSRLSADRLTHILVTVPVRKPIVGEIDLSSGFGMRTDPFLGRLAMHTGLDFRANIGDPVHATAAGVVVTAGWNGGYGNMVEIDHGNGLSTRYGHMSRIDVKVGQRVAIGDIVGRVGSTGRSTGPHLHYETRIDDQAVDPQKFLRAGLRLGSALQ